MKRLGLAALAWAAAAGAFADDRPALGALHERLERCVTAHARAYSSTREAPQDIADAAFAHCAAERVELVDGITARFSGTAGVAQRALIDAQVNDVEKLVRRAAIRAVLESRYPPSK